MGQGNSPYGSVISQIADRFSQSLNQELTSRIGQSTGGMDVGPNNQYNTVTPGGQVLGGGGTGVSAPGTGEQLSQNGSSLEQAYQLFQNYLQQLGRGMGVSPQQAQNLISSPGQATPTGVSSTDRVSSSSPNSTANTQQGIDRQHNAENYANRGGDMTSLFSTGVLR